MDIKNTLPVKGQVFQEVKDRVLKDAEYELDVQILETPKKPNTLGYTDGQCSGGYTCGQCSGAHTCGNCK